MGAEDLDHLDIAQVGVAADAVGLAEPAFLQDGQQRVGVIVNMQPVAHLAAVAIDRDGLALHGPQHHRRDQLLGELIGPVIVRAVGDDHR